METYTYFYTEPGIDYVPNEIIVKFKKTAADVLKKQLKGKTSTVQLKLSARFDKLNAKHRLKAIEQIFKNFKKNHQNLRALQTKSPHLLTKKERHILKRLA